MLYGKSAWDNLGEAEKESKITGTLAQAFVAAKSGTLPAGASIKDYWWSMFSPSMTPASYNSFTNNDWIPNRIGDAERTWGMSFDYKQASTDTGGGDNPPKDDSLVPPPGPSSSDWQLYAGIGIILAAIGFVVYKKMND
ncbi:MAG: hypothetical protein WCK09_15305 [Bacteroidota bacterium]